MAEAKATTHAPVGTVKFPCPKCGYEHITRTPNERKIAAKYTCPQCGFEGPN